MNPIELKRALKQLRLGGIAAVLETRLHQAQTERMAPIDLIISWKYALRNSHHRLSPMGQRKPQVMA